MASRGDVRAWEHGWRQIPDEHVVAMTALFGVSGSYLLALDRAR